VNEIGPVIAENVCKFFASDTGRKTIADLKSVGIDPKIELQASADGKPLAGKTIVVTGTLEKFDRHQIEQIITQLGGKASGSVSKKTSFVLAGENAGSKLDKAKELGVSVITEREFVAMVDQNKEAK
jgi:DNA ligase (NAD+)